MRNCNRFLLLLFVLFVSGNLSAQISGTNCFLQGQWLEIGVLRNGAFGAGGIPAGYHPHTGAAVPSGTMLAEVYDYGQDGWAVGTPQYMGDYTYPGSPFEGWGLQVNGGRTHAFVPGTYTHGGAPLGSLTGALTTYTNVGGRAISNFAGTASGGGMAVRQETRVDTNASWVVVTTVMTNTTGTAMPGVYYLRSCDPDNNQTWPGGGFGTNNIVTYQNDIRHRVLVSATSSSGPASYLGLGTKDCRAKAFIYTWWSMPISVNFADMYNETVTGSGMYYYDNVNHPGDIGIGLVYNIGTVAPGDSAIVSYAYVFNNVAGLDQAFPDPQIVVNGTPKISPPPPTPNYDTFTACESGLTFIPVSILNAEDKCWSWSKWTWSPSLGLASTTGVNNTITFSGLPPTITYTITGTDSGAHMFSCNTKTFYLTIISCNGAESNMPCVGDTLVLNSPGDSVGATYKWYGPFPSTTVISTAQKHFHFPATMADTGMYTVVKTVFGVDDTFTTRVRIIPLPVISVTTNQPYCQLPVSPMILTCTADSILVSYAWSGPAGYTSTAISPSINPFDSSMGGIYSVTVENTYGCKQTGSVEAKPGPLANFNFVQLPGCPNDSAIFTDASIDGAGYAWNFGDGTSSFEKNPPLHIYTAGHKVYTVTLTVTSANGCVDAETKTVDLRHTVTADFNTTMAIKDTVCNGDPIVIADLSDATKYGAANTPLASYEWEWSSGAGYTETTNAFPVSHTYPNEGIYQVTLKVTDNLGCEDTKTKQMVVLQPYINGVSDTTFCLVRPFAMENIVYLVPRPPFTFNGYGYTYEWSPAANLSSTTAKVPTFSAIGQYTYTLTATLNRHGCKATHVVSLNSILPTPLTNISADASIKLGGSYQLSADSNYVYTWTPNDGSLDNPNINNPIATPTVTTTYTVYGMDKYGCRDTAYVTIKVDSTQSEHIPTGFTPNGDGLNDIFRFNGAKHQKLLEMRVYNRWGEPIFYSNTREQGWDGTYKGVPQQIGVYYYTVILARPGYPENTVYKGEITLIR
jgi:gliding motility-associated-like protein